MPHHQSPLLVLAWTMIAAAGGMVRFVASSLETTTPISLSGRIVFIYLMKLFATGVVAGFTGLLFALLVSIFTADHNLQLIAAGTAGYTGPKTLDILFRYLMGRFLPNAKL